MHQNDPKKIKENYDQFCMDLPRIILSIDGVESDYSVDYVIDYFNNNFDSNYLYTYIHILTQTFLANIYICEYNNLNDINEHLLDDGHEYVRINTNDKTFSIKKKFKKVYIDDDLNYLLDTVELNINIDFNVGVYYYTWDYEFETNNFITLGSVLEI
jgi:hypothetical protein